MLSRMHAGPAFAGEVVTVVGRLLTVTRKRAAELVAQHGGSADPELSPRTTLVVVGADTRAPGNGAADAETDRRVRRAHERAQEPGSGLCVIDEDAFCGRLGLITPSALRQQYYPHQAIRGMYPAVSDEHLRYLHKWGLLRSVVRAATDTWYGFSDLSVIRQANDELTRGADVKAVLRVLAAAREGQLALDFQARVDTDATRVVPLRARARRSSTADAAGPPMVSDADFEAAGRLFAEGSALDTGEVSSRAAAMAAYRRALLLAPHLVPAIVNLGNLHYAEDHFPEAQALYLEAALTDPDCFEAHFNLGNLLHDLGRFSEAEGAYREALRVDPACADAHFYLAVTLEKLRRSAEARPHWKRYQELAPDGEWVELAREFSE
jgi:hypothetical protein